MVVYIARHAWAGDFGDPRWRTDSERELTEEGAERYMRLVMALGERGFQPEAIATSPYARCVQTAELVAQHVTNDPWIEQLSALEPGSDLGAILRWIRLQQGADVCCVGHNPDVTYLTSALLGDQRANIRFAKGAIAAVRFYDEIDFGTGELLWHTTAKVLGI